MSRNFVKRQSAYDVCSIIWVGKNCAFIYECSTKPWESCDEANVKKNFFKRLEFKKKTKQKNNVLLIRAVDASVSSLTKCPACFRRVTCLTGAVIKRSFGSEWQVPGVRARAKRLTCLGDCKTWNQHNHIGPASFPSRRCDWWVRQSVHLSSACQEIQNPGGEKKKILGHPPKKWRQNIMYAIMI